MHRHNKFMSKYKNEFGILAYTGLVCLVSEFKMLQLTIVFWEQSKKWKIQLQKTTVP